MNEIHMPSLNTQYRPTSFNDIAGQQHLVGNNGILRNMIVNHNLTSIIFYGPPGTGKTTCASILAHNANLPIYKLNAITAGLKDIKNITDKNKDRQVLLYLDEIQYFNKKQQQALLPFIEDGNIILIAATTDNPFFCCYDALRSRCIVLEFQPVQPVDICIRLDNIVTELNRKADISHDVCWHIATLAAGDVRRAINILELVANQYPIGYEVTKEHINSLMPSTNQAGFDVNGDVHYDLLSGLQKSIRGSDPNAALYYLARLLDGGDILSACRRLLVIASEDIGMAVPDAPSIIYACTETAKQLGLPEASIPLGHAAVYLATAPKSNSTHIAYGKILKDIHAGLGTQIPTHLQSPLFRGYKYPHDYPNHWVNQQYLPNDLKDKQYYTPGPNATEQSLAQYWCTIKQTNQRGE